MTKPKRPAIGSIEWVDLTVKHAERVRDFYRAVVGWEPEGLDMGGYDDFFMKSPSTGKPIAGVCHARGGNADLPPYWLVYVAVENLEQSMARCLEHGGTIKAGPKSWAGQGRYCVIQDPAGAFVAIVEVRSKR